MSKALAGRVGHGVGSKNGSENTIENKKKQEVKSILTSAKKKIHSGFGNPVRFLMIRSVLEK